MYHRVVTFTTVYNNNQQQQPTVRSHVFVQQNNQAMRDLSGGTNIQSNYMNWVQRRNMLRNAMWGNDNMSASSSNGVMDFFNRIMGDNDDMLGGAMGGDFFDNFFGGASPFGSSFFTSRRGALQGGPSVGPSTSRSSGSNSMFNNVARMMGNFANTDDMSYEDMLLLDQNNVQTKATTETEFNQLKRVTLDEYAKSHPQEKAEEAECSICLQKLFRSYKVPKMVNKQKVAEKNVTNVALEMPCSGKHAFHKKCIHEWLVTAKHDSCPVCRYSLKDHK